MEWVINITGEKDIDRKLQDMEKKIRRKLMVRAMRDAMTVVHATTVAIAPVGATGNLKRSIKVRAMKPGKSGFGINVVSGEGHFRGDEFYSGFVELGTKKMKAVAFMKKAFDLKAGEARDAALKSIRDGIERLAAGGT